MTREELKGIRKQLGHVQARMAGVLGISRSYYAELECGRRRITDEVEMLATTYAAIAGVHMRRPAAQVATEIEYVPVRDGPCRRCREVLEEDDQAPPVQDIMCRDCQSCERHCMCWCCGECEGIWPEEFAECPVDGYSQDNVSGGV